MRRALALVLWCTPGCALLDALASNDGPGPIPEPNEIGTEGEGEGEGFEGEGEPEGPCQSGAQLAARAVAVGFDRSCALGCDGAITCWGAGTLEAPAGPFVEVTVGQSFACGRRADGAVACFGEQGVALEGAFTTIRAGQGFVCGLDDSASLQCDGDMSYPSFALPTGPLSTLAAGWAYVCGERLESGALLCGGTFSAPEPPAVELHDVGVGSRFACGLDASGEIYCFDAERAVPRPTGAFTTIGVGDGTACAVRADNATLTCFTETDDGAEILAQTPTGRFLSVAVATAHACAVREDHSVVCWGRDLYGRLDVP